MNVRHGLSFLCVTSLDLTAQGLVSVSPHCRFRNVKYLTSSRVTIKQQSQHSDCVFLIPAQHCLGQSVCFAFGILFIRVQRSRRICECVERFLPTLVVVDISAFTDS